MGGRVPASKKASDGDPHPGPPWGPCPFSAAEMLPPSPLVEAAVGRLSATTAAKSSSLSALAEAGSRGPARPPWAAGGGPQQSKKGRRCRALSSRGSLRRGVRGRRRPDTPRTPNPAGRARTPRSGRAGGPGSAGPNAAPKRRSPPGFVRAPLGVRAVGGMRCARCRRERRWREL